MNFAHFIFREQEASFQAAEARKRDNSNLFSDFWIWRTLPSATWKVPSLKRPRVIAPLQYPLLGCSQTEYDIVRHQEATFQAAEGKVHQIQKSLNKI